MYETILWDNDGILVQTEEWYFEATRAVLTEEGVSLSLDEHQELSLRNNVGAWHLIPDASEQKLERLRQKRNGIYAEHLKTQDIFVAGVRDVLDRLTNDFRMGIVTSSRKDHFDIIHQRSGLLGYFDFVVASGDFTRSKPDPEPYLLGIERSGGNAETCLAIEDSERGVLAAKRAGLICWAIPGPMTRSGDFTLADRVLEDIGEVAELLTG